MQETIKVKQEKLAKISYEEKVNRKLLHSIFDSDQVIAIKRKSTKFMKLNNETLTKGLKLKFSCGTSAYENVKNTKYLWSL